MRTTAAIVAIIVTVLATYATISYIVLSLYKAGAGKYLSVMIALVAGVCVAIYVGSILFSAISSWKR